MKNNKLDEETQKIIDECVKKEVEKQRRADAETQRIKGQYEKLTPEQKAANNEFFLKICKKALKIIGIMLAIVFGVGFLVFIIMELYWQFIILQ
ncbi:MAG: hypothetical protein RR357_05815 [Clostridia bacterium]